MTEAVKIDDGGPAFARPGFFHSDSTTDIDCRPEDGMSLRDWFAGQALAAFGAAFLANGWHNPNDYQIGVMVDGAYRAADAMIAARKAGA